MPIFWRVIKILSSLLGRKYLPDKNPIKDFGPNLSRTNKKTIVNRQINNQNKKFGKETILKTELNTVLVRLLSKIIEGSSRAKEMVAKAVTII